MSEHTPGPWEMEPVLSGDKEIEVRGNTAFYWGGVVATIPRDDCDHDEAEANARLIAAAPDLLEALKALVDWQGVEHQAAAGPEGAAEDCPGDDTCRCPIVAQVNAAIAKAEGR